jgi:hypothetical protein
MDKDINKEPLLVIKYVWWKVWFDVFVLFIGILVLYSLFKIMRQDDNPLCWFFLFLIPLFLYGALEILLLKKVLLFDTKIEKRWFLFGASSIEFDEAFFRTGGTAFTGLWIVFQKTSIFFEFTRIYLLLSLFSKKDAKEILQILCDISEREASEFEVHFKLQSFIEDR